MMRGEAAAPGAATSPRWRDWPRPTIVRRRRVAPVGLGTWRTMIEVNPVTVLHTCRAALPVLAAAGGATSSTSPPPPAGKPMSAWPSNGATKHAVVALSASLHDEARRHRVKITTIETGAVDTDRRRGHQEIMLRSLT